MTKVELKHIGKSYPGYPEAVSDISFECLPGEFVVLVGPSGCGKSTILRMIAGLESIDSGELLFDSVKVNDTEPRDRDIGMVFQNYALYPHMTVYENIAFPLKVRKVSKSEIERSVLATAEMLDLGELLKRKPKELSGGQRQRVALGRAVVRRPKVFLFDEPLSNLDAKLRVKMRAEITKLKQELGITSVYVTHDQTEAMTMGTKVVVMQKGKIMQVGSPEKLYNDPDNVFTAGFIGSPQANFFEGKLFSDGEINFVSLDGKYKFRIDQCAFRYANNIKDTDVTVAVRPENIKLAAAESDINIFKDSVMTSEYLGAETYIRFGNPSDFKTARMPGGIRIESGTSANFTADSKAFFVFNKSGNRL